MKLPILLALAGSLLATGSGAQTAANRCGNTLLLQQLTTSDPAFMQARQERLDAAQQQAEARAAQGALQKTAAQNPIPVVFHVVVSAGQYLQMGLDTGIIRRVTSQLASLNADYSATNSDIGNVPTPFVPVIGNTGISFQLASGTSANTITPGIEVKIITNSSAFTSNDGFAGAKRTASGGLNGWDPARQLNIWVIKTDQSILGLCIPPSFIGASFGGQTFTSADLGVVVDYGAFGKREFSSQYFNPRTIDGGRTLTHEIGHYFELAHIWGDAAGCTPDDGISDTPPQDDATYCQSGCPTFPRFDGCSPSGNGIMFMNYMDYVDDAAMMLFTKQQVIRMRNQIAVGGNSYSLTQQPAQAVASVPEAGTLVSMHPNPTTGAITLQNLTRQKLEQLTVLDLTGRQVLHLNEMAPGGSGSLDLARFGKGMYFLKGYSGTNAFTHKIIVR
ncbi:MAG: T9SS type A sorting domain-containing protein [Sphingobacteriales bacterium]|nr:MAG: T9SS type A sorting domain-containing protein [Sphingobacteriales bacterium]